jgi:hypothetical protein
VIECVPVVEFHFPLKMLMSAFAAWPPVTPSASFRMRLFTVPVAETPLLAGIRETLLSEAAFQRFQRGVTAELKARHQIRGGAQARV